MLRNSQACIGPAGPSTKALAMKTFAIVSVREHRNPMAKRYVLNYRAYCQYHVTPITRTTEPHTPHTEKVIVLASNPFLGLRTYFDMIADTMKAIAPKTAKLTGTHTGKIV